MATTTIYEQGVLTAALRTAVHTVAASKVDTVFVTIINNGAAATTWELSISPDGSAFAEDQVVVPDQDLSIKGSGDSRAYRLPTTAVIRILTPGTGVNYVINGMSQDV